eukprot:scaffold41165_cov32-Prasinocladus_malaysianus.AAC.1
MNVPNAMTPQPAVYQPHESETSPVWPKLHLTGGAGSYNQQISVGAIIFQGGRQLDPGGAGSCRQRGRSRPKVNV